MTSVSVIMIIFVLMFLNRIIKKSQVNKLFYSKKLNLGLVCLLLLLFIYLCCGFDSQETHVLTKKIIA